MSAAGDLGPLEEIKHVVVLMMENRSFDHMLGYLTQDGMPEVNGLTGDESNPDVDGTVHQVWEFGDDQTAFHIPGTPEADKSLDPCHSPRSVTAQLSDGNGGFVKNFVTEKTPPAAWRKLPMGHYTGEHLPVYDHLARQFCVCDAWHSSIPGDTWPNRLYSLTGTAGPSVASQHVVTDDEHGGCYDHVARPPVNDGSGFATYGLRVPALVIGPRVRNFVCHDFFDHTALIKTILLRFAADPAGDVAKMGARVAASPDLRGLLGPVRSDLADHGDLHAQLDAWRARARSLRQAQAGGPAGAGDGDGAGQPLVLNSFAQEFGSFALAMRAPGLAAGHP